MSRISLSFLNLIKICVYSLRGTLGLRSVESLAKTLTGHKAQDPLCFGIPTYIWSCLAVRVLFVINMADLNTYKLDLLQRSIMPRLCYGLFRKKKHFRGVCNLADVVSVYISITNTNQVYEYMRIVKPIYIRYTVQSS